MVNLSDVAAMGGRPLAIVDVLWTPGLDQSGHIWEGMSAASKAYGVPIVGGHTTVIKGRFPVSRRGGFGKGKAFDHQFRRQGRMMTSWWRSIFAVPGVVKSRSGTPA